MRLKYQNKKESHDITLNLNTYIDNIHVFLDPAIDNILGIGEVKKKELLKKLLVIFFIIILIFR